MIELKMMDENYFKLRKLRCDKVESYGGLKYYRYGLQGAFNDVARKFGRLEHIIFRGKLFHIRDEKESCENLEETVLDLINYGFQLLEVIQVQKLELDT